MTREEHIAALEKYRDGILSGGISVPYDDLMIASLKRKKLEIKDELARLRSSEAA